MCTCTWYICVCVWAQVGETIVNNFHFVGEIWSFACVFEKWFNATARLTSAATRSNQDDWNESLSTWTLITSCLLCPWVEKQYTHNWTLHLIRRNILQMERYTTANAIWRTCSRLEQKPVKISICYPVLSGSESMLPQMLMCSQHYHILSLSSSFWKLLSLACTTKTLNHTAWRSKLYIKFALKGSEVIGLAITPAFLTNSWRSRRGLAHLSASPAESSDTLSVSSGLESRAASKLEKRQSSKLASLPMWMSEEPDLEKQMTIQGHLRRETLKTPEEPVPEPAALIPGGTFMSVRTLRSDTWSLQHVTQVKKWRGRLYHKLHLPPN